MLFEDRQPGHTSFAKDPAVIHFAGAYWMYYSRPDYSKVTAWGGHAFQIGIARGQDPDHWDIIGALSAQQPAEGNGICAPAAWVEGDTIHLFYQSYGQFPRDYLCHAVSKDGVTFERDASNPVVMPTGDWNNGRAIDADAVSFQGQLFLYWASRDPQGKAQFLGVSSAPLGSGYGRDDFVQRCDAPILSPTLDWEQDCIEAPAALAYDGKVYLFYAGAYNCKPQQIGCAVSEDGIHFTRLSDRPLLGPGIAGSWNACESGHPYVYEQDGKIHLFYQGSDDMGRTWRLSRCEVVFEEGMPRIVL